MAGLEFQVNNGSNMLKDVHVGDHVELLADAKFFEAKKNERYAGFVVSLDATAIGLSPTHPNNKRHGYVAGEAYQQVQQVTRLEISHVDSYRVIPD
jgi:hypothetical protein